MGTSSTSSSSSSSSSGRGKGRLIGAGTPVVVMIGVGVLVAVILAAVGGACTWYYLAHKTSKAEVKQLQEKLELATQKHDQQVQQLQEKLELATQKQGQEVDQQVQQLREQLKQSQETTREAKLEREQQAKELQVSNQKLEQSQEIDRLRKSVTELRTQFLRLKLKGAKREGNKLTIDDESLPQFEWVAAVMAGQLDMSIGKAYQQTLNGTKASVPDTMALPSMSSGELTSEEQVRKLIYYESVMRKRCTGALWL